MKKNLYIVSGIILASVLALVVFLSYSNNSENLIENKHCVEGTVLSVSKSSILLDVSQDSEYYKTSDKINASTLVKDTDNSYLDLKPGDYVAVYFDGTILESYPAQITDTYAIVYLGEMKNN